MAPLVLAVRDSGWAEPVVCNTGQHREMASEVLDLFGITSNINLGVMRPGQTLFDVTTGVLCGIQPVLEQCRPDWVVVQGDTTTTFSAALASYYQRIPVAHVEAGLRTGDVYSPWPEEMNRRLVSEIACRHFSPTVVARDNLLREGIAPETVFVTGNTGIDALKILTRKLESDVVTQERAIQGLRLAGVPLDSKPLVLITGHRRESFGKGFDFICQAIISLAASYPDHSFVYPVHPNPHVQETVHRHLGNGALKNIHLVNPLDYLSFVYLMSKAALILTDSGGIQEEAPALGKRVIVLREVTERKEGIGTGLIRLAGTQVESIVRFATEALDDHWPDSIGRRDVYGDGQASMRILNRLRNSVFDEAH